MLVHKTFHHYTVRRKQGGSQSARDNQGNAPKSVGASLRRQQEAALAEVRKICFLKGVTICFRTK